MVNLWEGLDNNHTEWAGTDGFHSALLEGTSKLMKSQIDLSISSPNSALAQSGQLICCRIKMNYIAAKNNKNQELIATAN